MVHGDLLLLDQLLSQTVINFHGLEVLLINSMVQIDKFRILPILRHIPVILVVAPRRIVTNPRRYLLTVFSIIHHNSNVIS